jgi:pantoate--beta-alanine ligase
VRTLSTQNEMRAEARAARSGGRTVGLVPTMGAWHEGHLSLLRAARRGCDVVVASVYVNPLQFGPSEDFDAYPRRPEDDLAHARREGVDVVFMPHPREMDPPGRATTVSPGPLGEVLEGAARPGHFDGVCTVVAQLFNIADPDVAFFGEKDAQQVAVVRRMTADLSFGVRIESCPTVRAPDGLALSSRNVYLGGAERARATVLYRALMAGAETWRATGDAGRAEREAQAVVRAQEAVELEYARAVDPETFGAPEPGEPPLLVIAARVGRTRLIDNLACGGR